MLSRWVQEMWLLFWKGSLGSLMHENHTLAVTLQVTLLSHMYCDRNGVKV